MDVLATVARIFAPLADVVPYYRFEGFVDPVREAVALPPGLTTGTRGFAYSQGGERACFRDELFEGFEVHVHLNGTQVTGLCEAGESDVDTVYRLVDHIMEYLPENLVMTNQSDWPGCLPGHHHPPEFREHGDRFAWVCPATHVVVHTIDPVL